MQVVHVPAILVVLCLRRFEVDQPIHARRLSVIVHDQLRLRLTRTGSRRRLRTVRGAVTWLERIR